MQPVEIIGKRGLVLGLFCLVLGTSALAGGTEPAPQQSSWAAREAAGMAYTRYRLSHPSATPDQLKSKHDQLFSEANRISTEEQKKEFQNYLDAIVIGSSLPSHNLKSRLASRQPLKPAATPIVARKPSKALERDSKRDQADDEPVNAGGADEVSFQGELRRPARSR